MGELIYQKSFMEFRKELTEELTNTAESFVRIGYLLKVARDTDVLEGKGYSGYIDFAQREYGLDKTQVSRFIKINDRFSEGGNSNQLMQQYKGFGYAKLTLMLTLPDAVNEELSPEMTKSEIQAVKEEVDEEAKVSDIERMIESEGPGETELEKVVYQLGHDAPELFVVMDRRFSFQKINGESETFRYLIAPNEEKVYSVRVPGIGRILLSARSREGVTLTNIRTGEKQKLTWDDLAAAWQRLIGDERLREAEDSKNAWSIIYGEEFPEAAPEKPKKESKVQKAKNLEKPKKTEAEKESERQAKIDRETKKKLEEKEDEEKMNAPLPSETRETTHEIKIAPSFFEAVMAGVKNFELRKNDRNYHVGDTLIQKEYADNKYTGREMVQEITYLLEDYSGLEDGYCILGTKTRDLIVAEGDHAEEVD